ncbi:FliH/SctL family protein [Paenibacillus silviterrae]|uniref:FliH/SctL family protein n=1 Tax=Paenibacillus silviterrae TaxID=3242194 RepID=UPI0025433AC7|nr:FliH/SctL family protein [Paenibacillus chinjuensis]
MSNVIKYFQYVSLEDTKIVEAPPSPAFVMPEEESIEDGTSEEYQQQINEANELKNQILQDAESFAEEQVRLAMEEAAAVKEQAQAEIEQWWSERRTQDQDLFAQARQDGFQQGYEDGLRQAEEQIREQYQGMLQEAAQVLEQSYVLKQQIIQESEPFLIDLSTAIAEKIIGHQLTIESGWVIELIQGVLARRREKGIITLCVSAAHFTYIQDAREELLLHIDSQAELQIIPDPSVTDHGCVVRSSFGSIDARIDTQLKEIKSALRQLANRNEG